MKKSLLFVAALAASVCANAQEFAYFATSLGYTAETASTAQTAGTAIGSTSIADAFIGADNNYKAVTVNGPKTEDGTATYKIITIDGVAMSETDAVTGIQGTDNPKDIDGGTPASTFKEPVSGAYFKFTAKANGFVYVIAKLSSNKSYTVFEEGTAIPYLYSQATDGVKLPQTLKVDLRGTGTVVDDVETLSATDHPLGILWPEQIYGGVNDADALAAWTKIGQNGVGFIAFPVVEGCNYICCAIGSKMSGLGFYTTTEEAKSITLSTGNEGDPVINLLAGTDGINDLQATKKGFSALAPMYNLSGQRVSGSFKGIAIQNGKKFINK